MMKIGTQTATFRAFPAIRQSLMDAWVTAPKVRRELRQFHGKRAVKAPVDPRDDLLILEIRRLREQTNIKLRDIHIIVTQLGFHRTQNWVSQTTQYHNRSHLVPAEGAEPYLKAAS